MVKGRFSRSSESDSTKTTPEDDLGELQLTIQILSPSTDDSQDAEISSATQEDTKQYFPSQISDLHCDRQKYFQINDDSLNGSIHTSNGCEDSYHSCTTSIIATFRKIILSCFGKLYCNKTGDNSHKYELI